MGSLYALMGFAMPSGASGSAAVLPALAMLRAANEAAAFQVGTPLQEIGVPSGGTGSSLTSALLCLGNLDPTTELQRFSAGLSGDAVSSRELGG